MLRIGVDENGLGSRLGPLIVTAVCAEVTPAGESWLAKPLRGAIRADLDDSKRLLSHKNYGLGEAWARVLAGGGKADPQALWESIALETPEQLQSTCPSHLRRQCWGAHGEIFAASDELLSRIEGHRDRLRQRGVRVLGVKVASVCTQRLNRQRAEGRNRFVSDLHAMESLLIGWGAEGGEEISATCGKVGGMSNYSRFFGPLAGRLHVALEVTRKRSAYHFPGLGEIRFVQDADSSDPLVMLASLVGKYIRELLMARVWRFYPSVQDDPQPVSGYHDSRTRRWVEATALARRKLRVVPECFERD